MTFNMKQPMHLIASLALSASTTLGASLSSGDFSAELNPVFPGLRAYTYAGETVKVSAASGPAVVLNGKEYVPGVELSQSGAETAEYRLAFKDIAVTMKVRVSISRDALTLTIPEIKESGQFVVRYVEIPGLDGRLSQVESLAGEFHVHRRGVAPHDKAVETAQFEGEVGEALLGAEDFAVLAALHELDDEHLLAVTEGPQGLPEGRRRLALAVTREDHDKDGDRSRPKALHGSLLRSHDRAQVARALRTAASQPA